MKNQLLLFCLLISTLFTCQNETAKTYADTILTNGNIYTVSDEKGTAIAIKDGLILGVGTDEAMLTYQGEGTQVVDLKGQFTMPGFIEGHGHFSGLGESLINLNFLKSTSWEEVVEMVAEAAKTAKPGEWIAGRGWHQEKWTSTPQNNVHGYPYHDALSTVSPNNPVVLRHASGHSLFANKAAMDAAQISTESKSPEGGEIVKGIDNQAIGVFEERAMSLINDVYDSYLGTLSQSELKAQWHKAIELAERECLENGITSFQDAGTTFEEAKDYQILAEKGELDIRLWSMLRHPLDTLRGKMDGFPIIDAGNQFYTCRALKSEVDGALGAFGAWLLKPYNDKPDFIGQNTTPISDVKGIAQIAIENDMQLCVHAIGDRANRVTLNIMEEAFKANPSKTDRRWRIEHAQHLDTLDIPRFKSLGVIASMQGIHCTSDSPFVEKRLGNERSRQGAYPWRSLLDRGVLIANGTDAPVEDVSPIECFYASVTRKRIDNGFSFFPEQRMTRAEAIYSYTLGNAYAAFEEKIKGSLEPGKVADIIVLSNDLINCTDEEILTTTIQKVMVAGKNIDL